MAKEHEMATSVVDQTKEDQTHSSMMAWHVHEFGPPNVMRFEQVLRPLRPNQREPMPAPMRGFYRP